MCANTPTALAPQPAGPLPESLASAGDTCALALTGPRPSRLGGYDPHNPIAAWVLAETESILRRAQARGLSAIYNGGALGFDQWSLQLILELGLGGVVTVARPFPSQAATWPHAAQHAYARLLDAVRAAGGSVVDVSPDPYEAWKMQARNAWMVAQADYLLAAWDGLPGGTGNCVAEAERRGRRIYRIDHRTRMAGWLPSAR